MSQPEPLVKPGPALPRPASQLRYQLLALDVDGTILDSDGQVSPRLRRAVRRAREEGTLVVLATGRRYAKARPVHRDLGLDTPLLVQNGALVVSADGSTILHHRHLARRVAVRLIRLGRQAGVVLFLYHNAFEGDRITFEGDPSRLLDATFYRPDDGAFQPVDDLERDLDRDPLRLVAFADEAAAMRFVKLLGAEPATSRRRHRMILWPRAIGDTWVVELYHPKVSKGDGLAALARGLAIPRSRILAVGDHINDVEMVAYAGLGVAMGNASEEVKAVADHVAASNDEDGLAEVIETFVLGQSTR